MELNLGTSEVFVSNKSQECIQSLDTSPKGQAGKDSGNHKVLISFIWLRFKGSKTPSSSGQLQAKNEQNIINEKYYHIFG